jgi:HD-GYP domain-containing protein (c-di-GMP phosphodiesterase class II)
MSIEEIRHYLFSEFPGIIFAYYDSLSDSLSSVSPFLYLAVIFLLCMVIAATIRKIIVFRLRMRRRKTFVRKLSEAESLQSCIPLLMHFLKKSAPAIKNIGIYIKDQAGYKLMSNELFEDASTDKASFSETILTTLKEHEKIGRYHAYTFALPDKTLAIRVLSFDPVNFERLKADLVYLSLLIKNFLEKDRLKSELLKARVLHDVKDIFSSPSFNIGNYFKFIGNLILKASNLDCVHIITPDQRISLGSKECSPQGCKNLKVRNTDIEIEICREGGIGQEDIVHTGRFLDLISAMLSFYSNKTILKDYVYVLETAVRSFEHSDTFYKNHSGKVEMVATAIGERLGLETIHIENLALAARLHDIGMIGDIYEITLQDLTLSEKDYGVLKYHPLIGSVITTPLDSVHQVSNIILQHHELNDGTGYPHGITAEKMLPESKILALSEMTVGLVSDRAHRKGHSFDDAFRQLADMVPHKIDEDIYSALLDQKDSIIGKLERVI